MVTKSIIDIDVDDSKFKKFYEMFEQYQGKLSEMPETWKKLGDATNGTAAAIGAAVSILLEPLNRSAEHAAQISSNLKHATKAQEQFQKSTLQSEGALKRMGKEAEKVAHTIFGMGKFVLKAGAWGTGLFSAGVFGLDRLANRAVGNERNAAGLGMTTGQYRAFGTDLGRFLNPSILANVAKAQNDYTGRVWLSRATGISGEQLQGMNAGAVSAQLAIKAHNWWQSTPARMRTEQNLKATGFQQSGLTLEDMRRLGATPLSELQTAQSRYGNDANALNISRQNTNALYDFSRKLTLAGQKLESAFTNKLAALGPSLGNLLTSIEKDAEALLNSVLTPSNIKAIQGAFQTFADYLGSKDFRASIASFVQDIGKVAAALHSAAGWLVPSNDTTGKNDPNNWDKKEYKGPYYGFVNPKNPNYANNVEALHNYEKMGNLPRNLLSSVIMAESSGDPNAVSKKGAQGLMQLMPATAKQYGVTDPNDPTQNATAGAAYYRDLFKHYKAALPSNQIRLALAAYNWGPGNVDKSVMKYGANDWEKHIPNETEKYINRVLNMMSKKNGTNVNIILTNKSGTNVAVSTNAAGI